MSGAPPSALTVLAVCTRLRGRGRGHPRPLPLLGRYRVEAGQLVPRLDLDEGRDLLPGEVDFVAAAWLERAGARRPEHVPRRALDGLELRAARGVEARDALEQSQRVR